MNHGETKVHDIRQRVIKDLTRRTNLFNHYDLL